MTDLIEVRADVPRDVTDVMDAVSKANRIPRNQLAVEIMTNWAESKVHEANLITRLTRREGIKGAP